MVIVGGEPRERVEWREHEDCHFEELHTMNSFFSYLSVEVRSVSVEVGAYQVSRMVPGGVACC